MPAHKLTPDKTTLRKWIREGLTHQQMADRVYAQSGKRVSRTSISAAISRAGLSTPTPRYEDEIPWRVKVIHLKAYPIRMLRLLGKRRSGVALTDEENRRLDSWLRQLEEEHAVVAYDPDTAEGVFYVDRRDGVDGEDGIPVRRGRVYTTT